MRRSMHNGDLTLPLTQHLLLVELRLQSPMSLSFGTMRKLMVGTSQTLRVP
jgi:hypothetical protein